MLVKRSYGCTYVCNKGGVAHGHSSSEKEDKTHQSGKLAFLI